jgi:hypothetical protein
LNESLIKGDLLTHAQVVISLMDEQKQLEVKVPKALMVLVKKGTFECKQQIQLILEIKQNDLVKYLMFVCTFVFYFLDEIQLFTSERMVISQLLTSNLPFWFDTPTHSIIWTMEVGATMHAFHVRFLNPQDESSMKSLWQIAIMEYSRQEEFAKAVNAKDANWVHAADNFDIMSGK